MFPNSKTPVRTTTLRGTKSKSSTNLNTAPDPIKDAYKLKSQIDAVQKSQQSFKTSEIIQIQTKLLTKAWKWISKYGIGSLNQYTKMKKQIKNYDVLIKTIASMQGNIETHFQALHRINKQHSISLNNIQSNICINNNNLLQFKSNTNKHFKQTHNDKQKIVSLLTKSNPPLNPIHQTVENTQNQQTDNNNSNNENTIDEQLDENHEIEFPLTIQQIDDVDNNNNNTNDAEIIISVEQHSTKTSEHNNNSDCDNHDNEQVENEDSDMNLSNTKTVVHKIVSDTDSLYPKLPNTDTNTTHKSTHSLDNVEIMSVQTIDVSAYKFQESQHNKFSQLLLLSDTELNDKSMMKETKFEQTKTDGTHKEERRVDDFSVTDKENKIVDEIMENLTKLEALSQDFNNFMQCDSDQYKLETQQVIKSKLKPLHEILEQRELGLLSELKYLDKEKMLKIKQTQHMVQQNKNYLKMKLVQCQNILQQYQTKWEQQYKMLHAQVDKNILHERNNSNNNGAKFDFNNLFKDNFEKKVQNMRVNLVKERKNELNLINNEVNQQIAVNLMEHDIANIKQMYIFTVNSANLRSLKEQLQNLGEFVDFAAQNTKNGKLAKAYNQKLFKNKMGGVGSISSSSPKNSTSDMDEKLENNRKFSKIINKKFNEFIGRKQSPSVMSVPTNQTGSIYSDSGMNLDHVNAVDAQSISSGNQSDNDSYHDTNINKSNTKRSVDRFHNDNQGNRPSVSISTSAPQSDINSDLP